MIVFPINALHFWPLLRKIIIEIDTNAEKGSCNVLNKIKKIMTCAGLTAIMFAPQIAQADTFVYHDPDFDFSLSFPDTWRKQSPETPINVFRVSANDPVARATCRIEAQNDIRAAIYPEEYMADAVEFTITDRFWDIYNNEYGNVDVVMRRDGAQMDKAHAEVEVIHYDGKDGQRMSAMVLASFYADTRYVMHCEATQDTYQKYAPLFGSIMGSFTLKSKYHAVPTGFYRDFLSDKK